MLAVAYGAAFALAVALALRGAGIEVHTIQSVLKDLAIPELSDQARKNIARAFEIPVTLLDSDETMATIVDALREHPRISSLWLGT